MIKTDIRLLTLLNRYFIPTHDECKNICNTYLKHRVCIACNGHKQVNATDRGGDWLDNITEYIKIVVLFAAYKYKSEHKRINIDTFTNLLPVKFHLFINNNDILADGLEALYLNNTTVFDAITYFIYPQYGTKKHNSFMDNFKEKTIIYNFEWDVILDFARTNIVEFNTWMDIGLGR